MEKFITKVQTNVPLNAIKEAIINLANMNIAVAILSLIYVIVGRYIGIAQSVREQLAFVYTIYMLIVSVILAYRILEILKRDIEVVDVFVGTLTVLLMNFQLISGGNIVALPIVAIVEAPAIAYLMKVIKRIHIPMKDVPPAVETSLNGVIMPVLVSLLGLFVGLFPYLMNSVALVLTSLTGFMGSYIVIALTIVAIATIWVKGLHGVATISTLLRPFWFYMMLVNGYFVITGQTIPYIGTESFMQWGVWLGGSGCTLGLTLAMKYFAKSKHLKQLGNDSFGSNIFNINENIIFGVPVAENPVFKVPFFLAPILCATVAYFAMSLGYVTPSSVVMPWVLPVPLGMFLSTLADPRSIILSLGLITISFIVYYPFMKRYDRELIEQEKGE